MPQTPHVVVVDDEEDIRDSVAEYLSLHGFEVTTADGGPALRKIVAGRNRIDLVILDLRMPGEDGISLARFLREKGGIGIMMLTAQGETVDRIIGYEVGADDYMVKPFAMPELTARVRALLRRSQARGGPRMVHGPLTLDTVARRAFLKGEPLELAAREWAVLEVLLAKVEKIVSKEAIIQAVAGWDDDLSPNAIEVYVSRLRSKLEPAGVRIRTVRGFGYMLEEFKDS